MKLRRVIACLIGMALVQFAYSQPFPKSSKYKVGMTWGPNITTIFGSELENPTPRVGMALGASFRQKLNKNLHFGAELNASFRGSNFNNGGTDAYNSIRFIYFDLPINLMFNTSGKDQNQFLTVGLEPAYQTRSEIFVLPDVKARYKDQFFKPFDVAALIGYHFDFYYFGLRPSVRWGLTNINDNLLLENVMPETGKNGVIQNFTFDLKFYF